jgi:hypothetical protein
MVWHSYGKAQPCLTSGGGAAARQPLVSREASALGLVKYINAVSTVFFIAPLQPIQFHEQLILLCEAFLSVMFFLTGYVIGNSSRVRLRD